MEQVSQTEQLKKIIAENKRRIASSRLLSIEISEKRERSVAKFEHHPESENR